MSSRRVVTSTASRRTCFICFVIQTLALQAIGSKERGVTAIRAPLKPHAHDHGVKFSPAAHRAFGKLWIEDDEFGKKIEILIELLHLRIGGHSGGLHSWGLPIYRQGKPLALPLFALDRQRAALGQVIFAARVRMAGVISAAYDSHGLDRRSEPADGDRSRGIVILKRACERSPAELRESGCACRPRSSFP